MIHEALHIIHQQNSKYSASLSDNTKIGENKSFLKTKSSPNVQSINNTQIKRGASFVVGQKLRESKWFHHDETKILCAVLETGFIVELKKDDEEETQFGIVIWNPGQEKSKNPDFIQIYTIQQQNKSKFKVYSTTLREFWPEGTTIRINNQSDRDNTPHSADIVRCQVDYAEKKNKLKWHNSEHFVYWCRYGPQQTNHRVKQISESVKWGNIGINAGLHLLRSRKRSSNK